MVDHNHIDGWRRSERFARFDSDGRVFAQPDDLTGKWWWLWLPLAIAVVLPVIYRVAPEFYVARVLPEGYGLLELLHFFVPLAGFVVGLHLLSKPAVKANPLWWGLVLLGALACLYSAGEEHSWGQHFFHWQTPEYWGQINRQNETNLHNTLGIFNHLPRQVLEAFILIAGVIIPIAGAAMRPLYIRGLEPFMPSIVLVPVAVAAMFYKIDSMLQSEGGVAGLVVRPSEAAETFYYLFMLYYLIMIARRIRDMKKPA